MMEAAAVVCRAKLLKSVLLLFSLSLPITIAVAEPLAFVVVVLWLISRGGHREAWRSVPCSVWVPMLLFSLLALIASVFGQRPQASLWKCHRLLYLLLPVTVADIFASDGNTESVPRSLTWYLVGVALLGVYDVGRLLVVIWRGGDIFAAGNMRDPQFHMTAVCLTAGLISAGKLAGGGRAAVVLYAAGLLSHFKRGTWAAGVLGLSVLGAMQRRLLRLLVVVAMVCLFSLTFPAVRLRLQSIPEHLGVAAGGRGALWLKVAPRIIKDHPLGMGLAAVRHEDLAHYYRGIQPHLNHLHNNVLEVTLETGWLGGVIWIWWMAAVIVAGVKRWKSVQEEDAKIMLSAVLASLVALLANGLVEYNFGDGEIFLLFCLLLGWIFTTASGSLQAERHDTNSGAKLAESAHL